MSHTKGPWKVVPRRGMSDNSHGVDIVTPDAGIAWVFPIDPGGIEGVENANLMAAAPEVTALLQELVDSVAGGGSVVTITDDKLAEYRAALAKARGAS